MFSVVIPLFNKAPYIQRALDSVYAQSCPADEIIIVNDGSTDGGDLIAKSQRDPRVRVIDQQNQGVSVARNVGIATASQPYVAFLDADDEWLPGFLARIKEMAGWFPDAGLYGTGFMTVAGGQEINRYGVRSRSSPCPRVSVLKMFQHRGTGAQRQGSERPAFGPVAFFKVWQRRHVVHTSSLVVPRGVALAVGFPVGVALCEDYEFLAKVALNHPVILASDVLVRHDVSVPGQAAEYWQKGYKKKFEVLQYHRFLAERMRDICDATGGEREVNGNQQSAIGNRQWGEVLKCESALVGEREANCNEQSFVLYCGQEFRKALMQRLYWGNFQAASEFYQTLGLQHRNYGTIVRMCGWISNHPVVHPVMGSAMRVVRWIRGNV